MDKFNYFVSIYAIRKVLIKKVIMITVFSLSFRHANKCPLCLLNTKRKSHFNPQLFLSGYENIRVHTFCEHSVFKSNLPVHTYSDSLRIH